MSAIEADLLVLGGGPAAIGPFVCAAQDGELDRLLARRVVVAHAGDALGAGALGAYAIRSDTLADVLLECLETRGAASFGALASAPETALVRAYAGGNLPLSVAAGFLGALGAEVARWLRAARALELTQTSVTALRLGDRAIEASLSHGGESLVVRARAVVLALGGYQDREAILASEIGVGSLRSLELADRVVFTDAIVRGAELDLAQVSAEHPIAILGGSHSALTTAHLLLRAHFENGAVELYSRRTPKLFYPSASVARADGYLDFDERDLCPTTGRLYRLAGLRFECRDLLRRILGVGDAQPEPRVRHALLSRIAPSELVRTLRMASIVVPAFGYRPRIVPITVGDRPLSLSADRLAAHVDGACRVLDARARPIPRLFGIGLASGFVPHGPLGGEPSFRGQTNGLWLYQNGVGRIVLRGIEEALGT